MIAWIEREAHFRIALARLSSPIEKVMMAYIMAQGLSIQARNAAGVRTRRSRN